jgi:hypothetical protein
MNSVPLANSIYKILDPETNISFEISAEESEKLISAQEIAENICNQEELFDLLLVSYREVELESISLSLKYICTQNQTEQNEKPVSLELKIAAFLSCARAYFDKSSGLLKKICEESAQLFHKFRRDEHSASIGYQIVELLRNHTQHRGSPFSRIYFHRLRTAADANNVVSIHAGPSIERTFLQEQKPDRWKEIEKHLPADDDQISLLPHIREYMDCISRIQNQARNSVTNSYSSARKNLFGIAFSELSGDTATLLEFRGEESRLKRKLDLFPLFRRTNLARKNLGGYFSQQAASCVATGRARS